MELVNLLTEMVEKSASDIFIVCGAPLSYKANGSIFRMNEQPLSMLDTENYVRRIFQMANISLDNYRLPDREVDFSFSVSGVGRFRANIYKQRGSYAAVLRFVPFELPKAAALGIPEQVMEFSKCKGGIVLITGAASSGKSTTLSCIINRINRTLRNHIITIEDPIEFLHRHDQSIISQREISLDTQSYLEALRAALRQSPDVILLGEMRDYETISVAMTAAETGQLVLSTLHTLGAASTIDRIIDVFPINQQHQIRIQLSMTLKGVVSQQLLPSVDGTLVPAFEIMTMNSAIKTMIREEKTHQIDTILQSSPGMQTMDNCISDLFRSGVITAETAVEYAYNPEIMRKRVMVK